MLSFYGYISFPYLLNCLFLITCSDRTDISGFIRSVSKLVVEPEFTKAYPLILNSILFLCCSITHTWLNCGESLVVVFHLCLLSCCLLLQLCIGSFLFSTFRSLLCLSSPVMNKAVNLCDYISTYFYFIFSSSSGSQYPRCPCIAFLLTAVEPPKSTYIIIPMFSYSSLNTQTLSDNLTLSKKKKGSRWHKQILSSSANTHQTQVYDESRIREKIVSPLFHWLPQKEEEDYKIESTTELEESTKTGKVSDGTKSNTFVRTRHSGSIAEQTITRYSGAFSSSNSPIRPRRRNIDKKTNQSLANRGTLSRKEEKVREELDRRDWEKTSNLAQILCKIIEAGQQTSDFDVEVNGALQQQLLDLLKTEQIQEVE